MNHRFKQTTKLMLNTQNSKYNQDMLSTINEQNGLNICIEHFHNLLNDTFESVHLEGILNRFT